MAPRAPSVPAPLPTLALAMISDATAGEWLIGVAAAGGADGRAALGAGPCKASESAAAVHPAPGDGCVPPTRGQRTGPSQRVSCCPPRTRGTPTSLAGKSTESPIGAPPHWPTSGQSLIASGEPLLLRHPGFRVRRFATVVQPAARRAGWALRESYGCAAWTRAGWLQVCR